MRPFDIPDIRARELLTVIALSEYGSFVAAAASAETEAKELVRHFDADQSMAVLFPDLYHRRIANALIRQETSLESARQEVGLIATATARTNMVERAYKDVRRQDERERSDRDRLDLIGQKRGQE